MSIGALKQALNVRSVDLTGLVEKRELLDALALATPAPDARAAPAEALGEQAARARAERRADAVRRDGERPLERRVPREDDGLGRVHHARVEAVEELRGRGDRDRDEQRRGHDVLLLHLRLDLLTFHDAELLAELDGLFKILECTSE